ncbi:MAG: MaoC family dehydratase N-terminal domain-containing protein [Actinomycetota bacterium]|nr:MaoC family dehydratase N-terminal domain-containing protein [Actinomycetota bacterium]
MTADTSIIGMVTSRSRVVIERGPVANFASALDDESPVYKDPAAAGAAGLAGIPAPPTFPFCMEHWGRFAEIQPEDQPDANPIADIIGSLMSSGGLILHGEQSFTYRRPIVVGDVLVGEGKVVDVYEKESSKGTKMTFIVSETSWTDERTGEPVVSTRFNLIHRA